MKNILVILSVLACLSCTAQERIRVSCVGNSVTYGYLLADREQNCYPAQLQRMLGDRFEVGNFGHSGATLMRNGHNPYNRLPEYRAALDFAGDIVVIHLGLNDTDPRNYTQRGEEFVSDYLMLIDSLRAANPSCRVYICLMTPIFHGHSRYLSGTRDWHAQIQDEIRRVALGADVELIDLFTPLHCHPEAFPDNLHPDPDGARILAQTVYDAITGHADVPLSLPAIYQNGMVLQREAPNVISGRAPAGYDITLTLAGKRLTAHTGHDGRWSVTLPAMKAGGPYRLSIDGRLRRGVTHVVPTPVHQTLALDSIYIGEVWLCSGQSNMEWVNGSLPEALRPDVCRTGRPDATDARIHMYRMEGQRTVTSDGAWSEELLRETNGLRFIKPASWLSPTAETVSRFSAIAYRVGRALADSLGCHVGLIANAIGGSGIESWIDRTSTEWLMPEVLITARPAKSDFLQDWVRKCIAQNTAPSQHPLQRHPFDPCYLYESSIAPLEGLTLRGVMWYQGESNAHNIELYRRQWSALTHQWRSVFRSADGGQLPFYTMQLSAISGRPSWGRFRDMQRQLADADPRTYLVVTHDVGEQWNVHPQRKDTQAARLAASILSHEYGRTDIEADSPALTTATVRQGTVTLTFSEPLADADAGQVQGFEICGENGLYHPAQAVVSGSTVTLTSPSVPSPTAVRYAWQDFTQARLHGQRSGMMVSTFSRTL